MAGRLPAHLEVAALIRRTQAEGGFATVLRKGEPDAGTILVVLTTKGAQNRAYERMPSPDGSRRWTCSKYQDIDKTKEFDEYLVRRGAADPDLWIVELDSAAGERLIGLTPPQP